MSHESRYLLKTKEINEINDRLKEQVLERAYRIMNQILYESDLKPWTEYIKILNLRNDRLYPHSVDVALISLMMGAELGYSDVILTDIGLGALFHDIGKRLIPRRILKIPTERSLEEEAIFRRHCILGVRYVSGSSLPENSRNIILQHHERMDGSGYPKRLTEERISEYAKIVMVADTFDYFTADIPSMEAAEALKVIKKETRSYPQIYVNTLETVLNRFNSTGRT